MKNKSKNILITGVSTGIGYDLAKVFLRNDYTVFGSVRKQEDADRLTKELGDKFSPLLFDVTDFKAIENAAKLLEKEIGDEGLGGLVNNAGIAIGGPIIDLDVEDFRHQFEVNLFGLIKVTQEFLPLLGARNRHTAAPGKIIQISSVSGNFGMPFMGAYASSKHALEGLTESLRKELLFFGIDVVLIQPGAIKTPIWNKGATEIEEKFKDSPYFTIIKNYKTKFLKRILKNALSSETTANTIFKAFEKKQSKARVVIVDKKFKNYTLVRMLPTRTVDKKIGKALGLLK